MCAVNGVTSRFVLRTVSEFEALTAQKAPSGKHYFQHKQLQDIICAYPMKSGLSEEKVRQTKSYLPGFPSLSSHTLRPYIATYV